MEAAQYQEEGCEELMQLLQQEGQVLVTIAYIEQDQHLHGEQRVCLH